MRFRSWLAVSALLATGTFPAGAATPFRYSFLATVTATNGGPPSGTRVPIIITVDPHFPADAGAPSPREATYSGGIASPSGTSPIISATIAGKDARFWFDSVHIEKDFGGISRIAIQSAMPQYGPSLCILLTTTMKGVVKSVTMPRTITASSFQSSVFSIIAAPGDSFSGTLK